jgi:DNA anti-recombination protein RmuC
MERQELRDMIETIDEEENAKLKKMKDDFEGLREETKNKNVEELESMKHDLIKKIDDLDKEFEVSFNRYVSETEQKADQYKHLLDQNETSSQ